MEEDFRNKGFRIASTSLTHVLPILKENTRAIDMKPVVPVSVRNERNKILRNLSYQKMQYFTALCRTNPQGLFNAVATRR
jgi:hypothetical protein